MKYQKFQAWWSRTKWRNDGPQRASKVLTLVVCYCKREWNYKKKNAPLRHFGENSLLSYAEKGCGKCHRCYCAEEGWFLFPTSSFNSGTILSRGDGWESLSWRAKFSTNFVTDCSLGSFIYRTSGTKLTGRINWLKCCCSAVPYSLGKVQRRSGATFQPDFIRGDGFEE